MRVFLTGGAGYIGSHIAVALIEAGHDIVIFDNFSNSYPDVIVKISQITGKHIPYIQGDVCDRLALKQAFKQYPCDAVIHLAGLKAVGESGKKPLEYYQCNVGGTLNLLQVMQYFEVFKIIFSSTATVYGKPLYLPVDEKHPLTTENIYAETKLAAENILRALHASDPRFEMTILRYFNPVGAHKSGLIGENPRGIPNNLMPFIAQVAAGFREQLVIHGDDYDTKDGTGVRDYIHVLDLALGHVRALEKLEKNSCQIMNLGRGEGVSVKQLLRAFIRVSNKDIPFEIGARRHGDVAEIFADANYAAEKLKWSAQYNIAEMCFDMWNFQLKQNDHFTK